MRARAARAARRRGADTLLLLHGLGERSPARVPAELAGWPGPVLALDFTGHGDSTRAARRRLHRRDPDGRRRRRARAARRSATLVGRGLGAYVALLLAGARPKLVRGAILRDGPGLAGGGSRPGTPIVPRPDPGAVGPPDPFALVELAVDVRPPDYAASFLAQAVARSGLAQPLWICASERPPWLARRMAEPGAAVASVPRALAASWAVG